MQRYYQDSYSDVQIMYKFRCDAMKKSISLRTWTACMHAL